MNDTAKYGLLKTSIHVALILMITGMGVELFDSRSFPAVDFAYTDGQEVAPTGTLSDCTCGTAYHLISFAIRRSRWFIPSTGVATSG